MSLQPHFIKLKEVAAENAVIDGDLEILAEISSLISLYRHR